ncbi:MAG: hypoxanthine phosphoribosyltransferase [Bdellovibrionales bacterium]|nr:hypoxanthine phosphoribosyltransferase [Bdellovibrionales bacterium]
MVTFAKDIKELISSKEIQKKVKELGEQITKDYHGKELVCVCILKGSVIFFSDLIRHIDLPITIDFIRVSSYGNELTSSGDVRINKDLSSPVKGKHILLIEDIVDTGITLDFLVELLRTREPASLKVCSLLHKPSNKVKDVEISYKGFTIDNHYVVGYGLDAAEKYRNINFVGIYPTA